MNRRTSLGLFFVLAGATLAAGCVSADPGTDESSSGADTGPGAEAQPSGALKSGSLHIDRIEAAVRARDEARARAAGDPIIAPALLGFSERRAEHGLSADDTFEVRNVNADEHGEKHARLTHYYKGVRVLGSTPVIHTDRDGATRGERVDGLRTGIAIDTTPRLGEGEVRAVVEAQPERTGEPLIEPRVELVIYPVTQRFVKATGAVVTGHEKDLNAVDVERRVVGYKLAYQIETLDRGSAEPLSSHRYLVDASTGEILKVKSLVEHLGDGHTFKTNGPDNDFHVPISTYQHSSTWFEPYSSYRNFGVWDDDFSDSSGPNNDMNNLWGDGQIFAGDANATWQNRQTAIADVAYAMQGTWDMFSNVWGRQGYDDDFYDGHAYVHVGTEWDDASYAYLTGNISIGDSSGSRRSIRTTYDTVAHEFGHGVNDFSAELGGNSEGEGLSEASADIIGEISEAYEVSNGLANGLITIPWYPGPNYYQSSSGRNFKTGNDNYRFWTADLENYPDEHTRALPMDHAFYFLAYGSSSNPISMEFAPDVPWGMGGVTIDRAARIWMRAQLLYFNSDTDYAGAYFGCLLAAVDLYGWGSNEVNAVINAFAAIDVASAPASSYPGAAVSQSESEPNNTEPSADAVANGTPPAGAPITGLLTKRTMVSGGVSASDTSDWFWISVPSGKHLRVTMFPGNDADIELRDGWDTQVDLSNAGGTTPEQVIGSAPDDGTPEYYAIRVYHYSTALGQLPIYQLYVDIY
ncbi:MAG: M4 family metallopeptidase [Polyangiaceae bacterium]|nr:M4 family metallopeptidase [Polyangiaceae bacterium]